MNNNINFDMLYQTVEQFKFTSRPSNSDGSGLCTNSDLNKVINNISKLMNVFIEELEKQ